VGFFLLAFFYFFPNPTHFLTHVFCVSQWPEDTLADLYGFWTSKNLFNLGIYPDFNPFLGAPLGISSEGGIETIMPICTGLVYLLTSLLKENLAYNLFTLLGVSLSAWAMAILVERLTFDRWSGIFAGLIYGFSPNLISQTLAGHIGYTHAQWIPLYVLFLWEFLERPSLRSAGITGVLFAFIWLSTPYFGYFSFFFSLIFIFWRFVFFERDAKIALQKILSLGGIYLLSAIIMLPFTWKVILNVMKFSEGSNLAGAAMVRPLQDLYIYGASPWDYLLPSELNPILGGFTERVQKVLGGRHFFERSLYLGLCPLFFAGYAVWIWIRKKWMDRSASKVFLVSALIFCGFFMGLLSFRPKLNVGAFQLSMPSHFLYSFFPMFRVYARSGFFVSFCLAALAGVGFSQFLLRREKRIRFFCLIFFIGFLALEYTVVPPVRNVNATNTKPVYQWLAQQPEDFIVAEYPLSRNISLKHYQYLFAQRFHGKRLMNGASEKTPLYWLTHSNRNLWEVEIPKRLATLGVKYIIFHKEFYRKNIHRRILNASGLKLIKDFPDVFVFEVVARPLNMFWILGNSYPAQPGPDGQFWSWFAGEGMIVFYKRSLGDGTYVIRFNIASFKERREVSVFSREKRLGQWLIEPGKTQEIFIEKIVLNQGLNTLSLEVSPGMQENEAGRKVSVAVSDFQIME
jgi:hypothetical protein